MATPNMNLPQMPQNTFQPSTDFNLAMQELDVAVPAVVQSVTVAAPPATTDGDIGKAWIIAASATGVWAGKTGQIAFCTGANLWRYVTPKQGWKWYSIAQTSEYRYDGAAWAAVASGGGATAAQGAKADSAIQPDAGNFTNNVVIERVNPSGAEFTIRVQASNAPVIHYEYRNDSTSDGRPLANQLIGAAGARPWAGSDWTAHSAAAYHFGAAEDHTSTSQATYINLVVTPYGSTVDSRYAGLTVNADGDVVVSKGLSNRMVNSSERGRGLQVLRQANAELSVASFSNAAFVSFYRGIVAGGTPSAPQATASGAGLGFGLAGYDGTNYTGTRGLVGVLAAEAYTSTAGGTEVVVETTPIGSVTRTRQARFLPAGGLQLTNVSAAPATPVGGAAVYVESGVVKAKLPTGAIVSVAGDRTVVAANRGSTAISLTAAAYGNVIYDVEAADAMNEYNPATGVFTPAVAGTYLIQMSCHLSGVGAGAELVLRARSGGTEIARVYNNAAPAAGNQVVNGVAVVQLAANASVDFQVYVGSGTPSVLANSATGTRLGIQRIS